MQQKQLRALVSRVEAEGDSFPPACACGCGEPSRMGTKGYQKYLNKTHAQWGNLENLRSNTSNPLPDGIPIESFRAAIHKIKTDRGWSLRECAKRGGQQPGWLHTYMYDRRYKTIGREVATAFLRRLAGECTIATTYEQRTAPAKMEKTAKAIKGIGMDQKKPKMKDPTFLWNRAARERYVRDNPDYKPNRKVGDWY